MKIIHVSAVANRLRCVHAQRYWERAQTSITFIHVDLHIHEVRVQAKRDLASLETRDELPVAS